MSSDLNRIWAYNTQEYSIEKFRSETFSKLFAAGILDREAVRLISPFLVQTVQDDIIFVLKKKGEEHAPRLLSKRQSRRLRGKNR